MERYAVRIDAARVRFPDVPDRDDIPVTLPTSDGSSGSGPPPTSTTFDSSRFAPGAVIAGRYRVAGFLGKGGMGEVYRADDLSLGQAVALKFLPAAIASDEARLAQFRSEVRIGREVAHPNVCRVYDIVESDEGVFLAMEYVDGEDLATLIRRIGRLPQEKAVEIARQICAGVAAAHDKGVLHRDLKPANIMLDGRGRVRVTDFGIAALAEQIDGASARTGTPVYMAPEQLAGESVTAQSDVYALGLVLYELFTGKRAFDAETLHDLRDAKSEQRYASPATVIDEIDPSVERVIARCLEPEPSRRPQGALAVAAALPGGDPLAAALAAGETPSPQMVAGSDRRGRLHPLLAVGLLAFYLGVIGALFGVTSRFTHARVAPLDKPPVAMIDRAKDMLAEFGVAYEVKETAHGYDRRTLYRAWALETRPDDWERLQSQARPAFAWFWYRVTPVEWNLSSLSFHRGFVRAVWPRWSIADEAYISLDLDGQLRRFYRVPPNQRLADEPGDPPAPFDFAPVFDLAELQLDAFEPTEPRIEHQFRVDERRAWEGVYPEEPDIPIRIEAGVRAGELAYFLMLSPWDDADVLGALFAQDDASGENAEQNTSIISRFSDLLDAWLGPVAFGTMLSVLFAGGFLTHRHLARRSADISGASAIGMYGFVMIALAKWLSADSVVPREAFEFLDILAWGSFMGLGTWSAYIAFEPIVRRRWPTMLVAWTRLVHGRPLDPFVGRSVLVGACVGILGALLFRLVYLNTFANEPHSETAYSFSSFAVMPQLGNALVFLIVPVLEGFMFVLMLVGLRRLVRRGWLAAMLLVPIVGLFREGALSYDGAWVVGLIFGAGVVLLYMRLGVLGALTAMCVERIAISTPPSIDVGSWTFAPTVPGLLLLIVIGFWGAIATQARAAAD